MKSSLLHNATEALTAVWGPRVVAMKPCALVLGGPFLVSEVLLGRITLLLVTLGHSLIGEI